MLACALGASVVGGAPSPTALEPDENQSTSVEPTIRHQVELESLRYAARYALAYRTQDPGGRAGARRRSSKQDKGLRETDESK